MQCCVLPETWVTVTAHGYVTGTKSKFASRGETERHQRLGRHGEATETCRVVPDWRPQNVGPTISNFVRSAWVRMERPPGRAAGTGFPDRQAASVTTGAAPRLRGARWTGGRDGLAADRLSSHLGRMSLLCNWSLARCPLICLRDEAHRERQLNRHTIFVSRR